MKDARPILGEGERLVLVSNRLPVILQRQGGKLQAEMAAGGLATGLSRPHRETGGWWIGWPGRPSQNEQLDPEIDAALRQQRMIGVALTEAEHLSYYTRISNRCLWPLFHYFTDQVEYAEDDWETYRKVNRKFTDKVLEVAQDGDLVFVQDFHLMLVPEMLRRQRPGLRIGFFLHIPFPSSEIYRVLPRRGEVLRGLLGADMVAFHTLDYLRHFRSSLRRVLGLEVGPRIVPYEGREVQLMAQPLGIDAEEWRARGKQPKVREQFERLQQAAQGRRIILGVDRLDYTKGIPARLKGFAKLLENHPELADQVMMIQVAVPSRVEVEAYRHLKDEVDRLAGDINSRFGQPGFEPLHYQFRGVSPDALSALYQIADVALVTPLRDGLNLVAKEYVAARTRDDGVLILGEFTGAAWELGEALQINPFDIAGIAETLKQALDMSPTEQARRMAPMRRRVGQADVHLWADKCLDTIRKAHDLKPPPLFQGELRSKLEQSWRRAPRRLLFLDYDGTLRELTTLPSQAVPDEALLGLLHALGRLPATEVWVVSGRPPDLLDEWLGETPVGLIAEHGAFLRPAGQTNFQPLHPQTALDWRQEVQEIFEKVASRVPGSLVEAKPFGLAWHYRAADPSHGVWQARDLTQHLEEVLGGQPVEVLSGNKVVEVRPAGIDKGSAVQHLLERVEAGTFVLAAGDDKTDEDLFRKLPPSALALLIGARPSAAPYRLPDPKALRHLLAEWAAAPSFLPSISVAEGASKDEQA